MDRPTITVNASALHKMMSLCDGRADMPASTGVAIEPHPSGKGTTLFRMTPGMQVSLYDRTGAIDQTVFLRKANPLTNLLQSQCQDPSRLIEIDINSGKVSFAPVARAVCKRIAQQNIVIAPEVNNWRMRMREVTTGGIEFRYAYSRKAVNTVLSLIDGDASCLFYEYLRTPVLCIVGSPKTLLVAQLFPKDISDGRRNYEDEWRPEFLHPKKLAGLQKRLNYICGL